MLRYDVIVVDEAHERTLNTDFLCGALKKIQRIRKSLVQKAKSANGHGDAGGTGREKGKEKGKEKEEVRELKIVIMSATLDPAKFKNFFETCVRNRSFRLTLKQRSSRDALMVKGRVYNVDTRHVTEPVDDFIESAAKTVVRVHTNPEATGDILVFMPGMLGNETPSTN